MVKAEEIDGVRVLKLKDREGAKEAREDMQTMLRLWSLLSGGQSLRDTTVVNRQFP